MRAHVQRRRCHGGSGPVPAAGKGSPARQWPEGIWPEGSAAWGARGLFRRDSLRDDCGLVASTLWKSWLKTQISAL